jgi:hypothetical protein
LHLVTAASAVDNGSPESYALCRYDIDGDPRDDLPDIGADELVAE